jgi:hypothetical protein
MVTTSTKLDPSTLVAKLHRYSKQAKLWPEQPPPAERTRTMNFQKKSVLWPERTKSQNDEL